MAGVRGGRGRLPEGEAPDPHVAEESKRVIKELVAKQTLAGTSLEQQRARERERQFHRAAAVLPLSSVSSGTSSLQDFTASAERARRVEDLAGAGLPLHDLQLLLGHEENEASRSRLSLPERLAREERLQAIQRRLASTSSTSSTPSTSTATTATASASGERPGPGRHVQELDASLRLAGRLTPMARLALLKAGQDDDGDQDAADEVPRFRDAAPLAEDHPAGRLGALERGMFGHLDAPPGGEAPAATSRKRRRLRQAVDQPKAAGRPPNSSSAVGGVGGSAGGGEGGGAGGGAGGGEGGGAGGSAGGVAGRSLWDVRDAAVAEARLPRTPHTTTASERRPHGPARAKQYTIQDGKIVELGAAASRPADRPEGSQGELQGLKGASFEPTGHGALSPEDLRKNRMSLEEIRQLPRFASYEEGTPSTVLYVKNLDGGVTEDDLAAVFGSFRAASPGSSLTMRLCTGRMRGQAFVTFPSQDAASAALDAANGFLLRGRPMILQYGRSQQ